MTLAEVDGACLPESSLSTLDPFHPDPLPLLLQTGYLTITGQDQDGNLALGFPNREVRTTFVEHLLVVALNRRLSELAPRAQVLGCSDLVIDMPDTTWIFEFKRDSDPDTALAQIARKEYAHPWTGRGKPVHLVAVTFGSQKRNIIAWQQRPFGG